MKRKCFSRIAALTLLILLCLVSVFPLLMLLSSVTSTGWRPFVLFFTEQNDYISGLMNSLLISLATSLGTLVVSLPAAFFFAKSKIRGKNILFFIYMIVLIMPFQVTMLPEYLVSRFLSLYNTAWALILPGIFSPFAVFLLTQMMKSILDEQLEAAEMETSSLFTLLTRIVIPQIKAGIVCVGVLSFTESWNAVSEPLVLLESKDHFPLALLLSSDVSNEPLYLVGTVCLVLIPCLLYSVFAKDILKGLENYKLK